jgi:hypothetical protein
VLDRRLSDVRWPLPLPRQVRSASSVADTVFSAVSRATRAYANAKRRGANQWAFRMRAQAAAEQKAARQARKTGRGTFGLSALVAADQAVARRRRLYSGFMLRRGKSVMWVTTGPKLTRKHRATGRPVGRPRHDDDGLERAVADLQKTFRVGRCVAENQVIATMPDVGTTKDTSRWRWSMRARLRKNRPTP